MTFRCTGKARERLKLKDAALAEVPAFIEGTEWHLTVLILARRPFYLVSHSISLYSVLVPAAGSSTPATLAAAVRAELRRALAEEGYQPTAVAKVVDDGPDRFCKATDRRVLGSMNDFANQADWSAHDHGAADTFALARACDHINESWMSILGPLGNPRTILKSLLSPKGAA